MAVSAHLIHLGAGKGCELTTVGSGTPSSEDFDLFSVLNHKVTLNLEFWSLLKGDRALL